MNKAFEKIVEKLEEELKLADEEKLRCTRENPLQFDSAKGYANGVANSVEIVKQEAEKYKLYDTISIHTNGLEEGIRCAVCTNQIKSDTGCDGGCCVDENLVKRICDVIHKFECKP